MGNIKSQLLDPLSKIAADNCKVTYSFGNGRSAGFEPRLNTGLVTAAFNDDLTDCVEVFTPFSAFSHLGNGEGLFRNARDARELALPYFGEKDISPEMIKAVLNGLETFQENIARECKIELQFCKTRKCELSMKKCLESKRLEEGRNAQLEMFVHQAHDKISRDLESRNNLIEPSF